MKQFLSETRENVVIDESLVFIVDKINPCPKVWHICDVPPLVPPPGPIPIEIRIEGWDADPSYDIEDMSIF